MKRVFFILTIFIFLASCFSTRERTHRLPGKYERFTLLPNGWKLSPAGMAIPIGELPLNMVVTSDGRFAITSNNGTGEQSLSVVDLEKQQEVQRFPIGKTWRGLALDETSGRLYVSGGNDDVVLILRWQNGRVAAGDTIPLPVVKGVKYHSISGLDVNPLENQLFVVTKHSNRLFVFDIDTKNLLHQQKMPGKCYDVKLDHQGQFAYVSVWGKAQVLQIDTHRFTIVRKFATGDHPCEMIVSPEDRYLFVANANANTVSLIDIDRGKVIETLNTALTANAPPGSTPNALAYNAKDKILLIANADNNYLSLFDVGEPGLSKSLGFIPVGWYPTAVKYQPRSDRILVANAKGLASMPNPQGPKPGRHQNKRQEQYIGSLFKGALSVISFPDEEKLAYYTRQVYANTPYVQNKIEPGNQTVVPAKHDLKGSRQIRHVFYIIRENRTYDQVLGDLPHGNGDSSLCLFPRKITPNAHKIAETFVLFDNFYVDAEVSADGHNWTMAAYATDYVEKTWPTMYGGRGGRYDYEGGVPISSPSSGYIWNAVLKRGLTLRNYGEFTYGRPNDQGIYVSAEPALQPHTCPEFPGFNTKISDVRRYEIWEKDFTRLEKENAVPALSIIRLPNDHTAGTRKGYPTIPAMIADNDYALGLIVQRISRSSVWKNSVIISVEDDAQNGSDHVDAHRSVLLIAGPHVRRGFVDHTMYSTSGVLKTIELILGLPVMTQFDLSATPLLAAFQDEADIRPYQVVLPEVDMKQTNDGLGYGAQRCEQLNLAREDAIPDVEFNEIIWKAMRGADVSMPAPVRNGFVRITEKDDD